MASRKLKQLGRYRIEAELGRGAMGVVYRAHDPVLDRTVALKTIALDDSAQDREEYEARFFQEAKAAARLNHPALITIYDFGEEGALAYMAMELLDGHELAGRMKQAPPSVAEAVSIAQQVAEGLAFAHDHGVIHRDIKPGNIMLLPRGRVKIMDFGIARLKVSDVKTQAGTRLGTPRYMSPEQVGGGALDHRTDIFSLGIVLHEMLTGAQLFHGSDLTHLMHNVANFEPPPPSRINPAVPPLLDLVVRRALEKIPAHRYTSAWEMMDDLRGCQQELGSASPAVNRRAYEDTLGDSAGDKARVPGSGGDKTLALRRQAPDEKTANLLTLSRSADSAEGLARLQASATRDRQRLARVPRPPGLLRRLQHDRDLARLVWSLVLVVAIAGVAALS